MSVEFEENNLNYVRNFNQPVPKLAGWLIRKGFAKDIAGANKVELSVVVVCFVLAIIVAIL